MGKFLGTGFIDTVEIFLIETATPEADFRFVDYAGFIRQQKQIYGKEKGLAKHYTMGDYLIQDFTDFSNWIINRHEHLLNDTQARRMSGALGTWERRRESATVGVRLYGLVALAALFNSKPLPE